MSYLGWGFRLFHAKSKRIAPWRRPHTSFFLGFNKRFFGPNGITSATIWSLFLSSSSMVVPNSFCFMSCPLLTSRTTPVWPGKNPGKKKLNNKKYLPRKAAAEVPHHNQSIVRNCGIQWVWISIHFRFKYQTSTNLSSWLTDWLAGWLTDWLTDQLTNTLTN